LTSRSKPDSQSHETSRAPAPEYFPERQRDELFKILEGATSGYLSARLWKCWEFFNIFCRELAGMKGVEQSAPHVYACVGTYLSVIGHLEGILAALAPTSVGLRLIFR